MPVFPCTGHAPALSRYELGSEEDDMDAVRRKATALTPRFHVMLVGLLGWAGSAQALQTGLAAQQCCSMVLAAHWCCTHQGASAPRLLFSPVLSILGQPSPACASPASWCISTIRLVPAACVSRSHPLSPFGATFVALLQTTYDVCLRDTAVLRRFDWSGLVIDEGHSLKGGCFRLRAALPLAPTQRPHACDSPVCLLLAGAPCQAPKLHGVQR